MTSEARNLFAQVLRLWRTLFAVLVGGAAIAALDNSSAPILLVTLASAFVFSGHEQRQWVVMPAQARLADVLIRVTLAFGWTYVLAFSQYAQLTQIVRP